MRCSKCGLSAVISGPALCKEHFITYFENKVFDTIKKFDLFRPSDDVCVAVSGGKDSLTVLYLAKKYMKSKKGKGSVCALVVDEGIADYRQHTISDLEIFCYKFGIDLRTVSFKELFGLSLDEVIKKRNFRGKPCGVCGTLRRSSLNRFARGFDVLVTGHNMDDEAQAVLLNVFRHHTKLALRSGPKTRKDIKGLFVQRVKPLYFCSEKEVRVYAYLQGFVSSFVECPYAVDSFRAGVRDLLNEYESLHPGTKHAVLGWFLDVFSKGLSVSAPSAVVVCEKCGEPCSDSVCASCVLVESLCVSDD
jgi:uncharacterized protein (TIGR00269 family)